MLILVRKENEQDQAHTFQDSYFESFQLHQLTMMCRFEHINLDNILIFFILIS